MARKGHFENRLVGRNPQTNQPYFERVWVEEVSNEDGPPLWNETDLKTTSATRPETASSSQISVGGRERGGFVPPTHAAASEAAMERNRDALQQAGEQLGSKTNEKK